jgi:hypothetical protein
MIPYKTINEKQTILFYADRLNDPLTKLIVEKDQIENKEEALHIAQFYWKMVECSNQDEDNGHPNECDVYLEKVLITLMAYFRSSGYEDEWEEFADI